MIVGDGKQTRQLPSQRHTCLINTSDAQHTVHSEGVRACRHVCVSSQQPGCEGRGKTAGMWGSYVSVCVCVWGSFETHYRVIKWWKSLSDFGGTPLLPHFLTQPLTATNTHTTQVGWVPITPVEIDNPSDGVKVNLGYLFTLTPLYLIPHIPQSTIPLHLLLSFSLLQLLSLLSWPLILSLLFLLQLYSPKPPASPNWTVLHFAVLSLILPSLVLFFFSTFLINTVVYYYCF